MHSTEPEAKQLFTAPKSQTLQLELQLAGLNHNVEILNLAPQPLNPGRLSAAEVP